VVPAAARKRGAKQASGIPQHPEFANPQADEKQSRKQSGEGREQSREH